MARLFWTESHKYNTDYLMTVSDSLMIVPKSYTSWWTENERTTI